MQADSERVRRGRLTLVSLFALFFLPVIAAIVSFAIDPGWTPFGTVNRGELLSPPRPLVASGAVVIDGQLDLSSALDGHWVLLHTAPAACPDACRVALKAMRQARLALGKDANRVLRVWLVSGAPDERATRDVLARFPGLVAAYANDALAAQFAESSRDAVYLLDPTGLLILRYGGENRASSMLKDLKRLLKVSKQD